MKVSPASIRDDRGPNGERRTLLQRDAPPLAGRLLLGKHQPDRLARLLGNDDRLDCLAGHRPGKMFDLARVAVSWWNLRYRPRSVGLQDSKRWGTARVEQDGRPLESHYEAHLEAERGGHPPGALGNHGRPVVVVVVGRDVSLRPVGHAAHRDRKAEDMVDIV